MSAISKRVLVWALLAMMFGGCSRSSHASPDRATSQRLSPPAVIVSPDWLRQHLADPRLVIVDAREAKEYNAGHIQGTVNIPMSELFVHDPASHNNLLPVGVVQKVLSEAGIDMDRTVVIYDGINFRAAASVFWALEVHGHPSVAVLEGTYGKLVEAGLPTSITASPIVKRQFVANVQPERLATRLTVLRAIKDGRAVILDARSDEEFRGQKSEATRKGHIPRATSIDFNRNLVFDKAGTCSMRFGNELLDLYRSNLDDQSKIICYCNTGRRASVSYLALRSLGYDCAVYDGSWMEWGNDDKLPIE